MEGLKNLFSSEHGVFGLVLIVGATVLCGMQIMTVDEWKNYTQVVFVAFGGTHVGIAVADALKRPETAKIEADADAAKDAAKAAAAKAGS